MRIGQGYDAHRFGKGRPLILGGITIPHSHGLIAHSDGDVLLHALCDALLGAAALGDIGRHFPDSSEDFENIDSRVLLREVFGMLKSNGYHVINVDVTVIAEQPKLSPYINDMRVNIADDLQGQVSHVNVKATTVEGMGFTGRKEGIAAMAVVLLDE